ncbi:MAG TPA: ISKra4 family transposase, partial [Chloroflexota bacterium]|nr:ISKra4 family transposase [Chloroflexota bacterium]
MEQAVLRLGTWLPFERVPRELAALVGVTVGRETVRRRTEAAGAALVAAEQATVERLARTWPAPERVEAGWYQVSVDGAMVPLVHGQWAEVKTLAVGLLERQRQADGTWRVRATALSYFSRLADADAFRRLAWVETHRRGVTLAPRVCAVVDGAEWCQGFVDWHCPDAVRILDFPHAAEYVSAAARSVFGADSPALVAWLDQHLHALKHGDPDAVLAALRALPAVTLPGPAGPHCPRDDALGYLTKRRAQIAYAAFQAAGYPIGSGVVESANKLVVAARL